MSTWQEMWEEDISMLLPYICPITMLQLRGGRAAVVGE